MSRRGYALTVYGTAQPAGSKRAFYKPQLGVRIVDANPKAKHWKDRVAQEAGKIAKGMLEGPLHLTVQFYQPRPKSHYRTGKNAHLIKPTAPEYPTSKPDTTKLLRGVEDAMTGVLYRDDAQIVSQSAYKHYGDPARVWIRVVEL